MYIPPWLLVLIIIFALWRFWKGVKKFFEPLPNENSSNNELSICFLQSYIEKAWQYLGCCGPDGTPLKIAIFGAGQHTNWLNSYLEYACDNIKGPEVVAILDDSPNSEAKFWGMGTTTCADFDPSSADAILISSDSSNYKMAQICHERFGEKIKIIDLYEGLPVGPYPK